MSQAHETLGGGAGLAKEPGAAGTRAGENAVLIGRRHPWRWVSGALAVVVAGAVLKSILTNEALEWDVVREFFLDGGIRKGLWTTIWLTLAVTGVGLLLGTFIAAMRMSKNPVLSGLAWLYIWIFRSVPLLVQLLLWFNIAYLYPTISLSVPFGPALFSGASNELISPLMAAFLGLTLHEAAYAAEIVRGGILSVDQGQTEAGDALGLSRVRIFRRIVLPQAMRSIVPAAGNMLIGTLKGTSIVSVIAVTELLYSAQFIYNRTFQVVPLLVVATLWYIIMTTILSFLQYFVERYYGRGATRNQPDNPVRTFVSSVQRIFGRLNSAGQARGGGK
ncbi:amino acid ABC transporter permease [Actinomadura sp. 1N219]|uniref:amino acid ABC transporter permease n=1 Tax=Actinomadura sp. 1N219 TaxID=3375152 RepID=UPI0037AE6B6A